MLFHNRMFLRQCRLRIGMTFFQIIRHLLDKPWLAITSTANHHAVCGALLQRGIRLFKAGNIPIHNHWNIHRLLHILHKSPIGRAFIHLAARTPMHGKHFDAHLLGNARNIRCI